MILTSYKETLEEKLLMIKSLSEDIKHAYEPNYNFDSNYTQNGLMYAVGGKENLKTIMIEQSLNKYESLKKVLNNFQKHLNDNTLELNQRNMFTKMEERVKKNRLETLENHVVKLSEQISTNNKNQTSSKKQLKENTSTKVLSTKDDGQNTNKIYSFQNATKESLSNIFSTKDIENITTQNKNENNIEETAQSSLSGFGKSLSCIGGKSKSKRKNNIDKAPIKRDNDKDQSMISNFCSDLPTVKTNFMPADNVLSKSAINRTMRSQAEILNNHLVWFSSQRVKTENDESKKKNYGMGYKTQRIGILDVCNEKDKNADPSFFDYDLRNNTEETRISTTKHTPCGKNPNNTIIFPTDLNKTTIANYHTAFKKTISQTDIGIGCNENTYQIERILTGRKTNGKKFNID